MKKQNKKNNLFDLRLFLKVFLIPYGCLTALSLYAIITQDVNDPDPLTWGDIIIFNCILLVFCILTSFAIAVIINYKKNRSTINEINNKSETKLDEKVVVKESKKEIQVGKEEDTKPKIKKKTNSKCLYTCESIMDGYEYKKMAKYFPKRMYIPFVIKGTILNLIFSAIIAIMSKSLLTTLVFLIIYQIFIVILYKVKLEDISEKNFNKKTKGKVLNYNYEFYEDYFKIITNKIILTINYSDLTECVENDTNFYFYYNQYNNIIILQKNRMDLKLINFLREKIENLNNYLGDSSNYKGIKKYKNKNKIEHLMITLFVLTIMSLPGAIYTMGYLSITNPLEFPRTTWVFWCWLPIPIISIILGYKYKKSGIQCTKNVICGFIIGFLLFIYGSFCFISPVEESYDKIELYKDIIDIKLPEKGKLQTMISDAEVDNKINYTIIDVYYEDKEANELVQSIKNSDNWFLGIEMKSTLKEFFTDIKNIDNNYYYIYNKTTNDYNTLPKESGIYKIYIMEYNENNKLLRIHKFIYDYK